ncbi:MAG: carbohydrate-binding family 9-like protein [Candidatus Neomarinimicrobiota bacterium]
MQLLIKFLIIIYSFVQGQGFWGNEFPEQKIEYSPKTYVCHKAEKPILLDGKLNDEGWEGVQWSESFVDIEGNLKPDPFYDTKVKMTWDEHYFYFGAMMEDPHVWATITARDAVIYKDNDFEIFLDPDGDTHNYYELEVNAFETEWDLILLKPYHDDSQVVLDSWDIPGLISKVHVDGTINDPSDKDKGWSIEIAIPWKALINNFRSNNPPKDGETWKVNFSRVHWDVDIRDGKYVKTDSPEFNWVWSPQGHIYMHFPHYWGLVQFSEISAMSEKIEFLDDGLDKHKWALRQVYFRQRNYFFKNERYTASLKALNLIDSPVEGVTWPPRVVLTPSGWEAELPWNDSSILIRKDGRVWVK